MPNWEEELYKQGRVTKVARNKEWGGEESGYKLSISPQQHFFLSLGYHDCAESDSFTYPPSLKQIFCIIP